MRAVYEQRVSEAIHRALKVLNIISEAKFPQIQLRAYHFINVEDWDKSYHLCIPLKAMKRLCYVSRDHVAYTFALRWLNEANNLARSGWIDKAAQKITRAIRYFIKFSEKTYIEERTAPYMFTIRAPDANEVIR